MAPCFENLIKHLQFVVQHLKQLETEKSSDHPDQHKLWELLAQVEDLRLEVSDVRRQGRKPAASTEKHTRNARDLR